MRASAEMVSEVNADLDGGAICRLCDALSGNHCFTIPRSGPYGHMLGYG